MKGAAVQLIDAQLLRVVVERDPGVPITWDARLQPLSFEDVRFETAASINRAASFVPPELVPLPPGVELEYVLDFTLRAPVEEGAPAPAPFARPLPIPLMLDVRAQGIVRVADEVESGRRDELAAVNGLALLYGLVRETVAALTSRMPGGRVNLPVVQFLETGHELAQRLREEDAGRAARQAADRD